MIPTTSQLSAFLHLKSGLLLEVGVPVEDLRRSVLVHVGLEELFQFVSQIGSPLLRANVSKSWMIQRALDVGQSIVLQELAGLRQVSTASVQELLESGKLSSEVLLILYLCARAHECWIHCKVNMEIELELLTDEILLTHLDGHKSLPKEEEVLSLS